MLEKQQVDAAMLYTSDHGEDIYIPVSEHFADSGKTVNEVIEDVIRYAVRSHKN